LQIFGSSTDSELFWKHDLNAHLQAKYLFDSEKQKTMDIVKKFPLLLRTLAATGVVMDPAVIDAFYSDMARFDTPSPFALDDLIR
jgi:hypothetical protein